MADFISFIPIITIFLGVAILRSVEKDSYDIDVPIQIIKPAQDNQKLELVESNLIHLSQLSGPVVIVAVIGKYQAERPFLMNQLMGKSTGFGYSVQPKTMGIWMWGQPVVNGFPSSKHKINLLFLDTGGYSTSNATENYDARVFAVSTLLSSHLLYNSVKIIDPPDIIHLESLARRAKLFVSRSALSERTFESRDDMPTFPPLTWVVQDFAEESVSETPKECFDRLMGGGNANKLFGLFKSVDCHKLPAAALDGRHLSEPKDNDLSPDYRQKQNQLIRTLRLARPREKGDHNYLTGPDLVQLLRALVNAANDGPLTEVHSQWGQDTSVDRSQATAVENCTAFYNERLEAFLMKNNSELVSRRTYDVQNRQIKAKAFELLDQQLVGHNEPYALVNLMDKIEKISWTRRDLNDKKIKAKCEQVKSKLISSAEEQLKKIPQPRCSGSLRRDAQSICLQLTRSFHENLDDLVESYELQSLSVEFEESLQQVVMSFEGSNELRVRTEVRYAIKEIFDHRVGTCSDEMAIRQSTYDEALAVIHEDKEKDCKKIDETSFDSWLDLFQQRLVKIRDDCIAKTNQSASGITQESASEKMKISVNEYSKRFAKRMSGEHFNPLIGKEHSSSLYMHETSMLIEDFAAQFHDFKNCCNYEDHLEELGMTVTMTFGKLGLIP